MKIKKKYQTISLINSNLLKYQTYKNLKLQLQEFKIENINTELKQVLKIIYLYSRKRKKILFVGFPYNKFLINQVNHLFISKKLYNKVLTSSANKMFNGYDLIVFNNFKLKDSVTVEYLRSLNLPLILFGECKLNSYGVNGSFKTEKSKNFCFFLIFSVLLKNI